MTETIVIVLLILLVGGIWYGLTRRPESNEVAPDIKQALEELVAAVQDVTLHLENGAASDRADLALDRVKVQLAGHDDAVEELDKAWSDLKSAIAEFAVQPTNSTLQSSILTTRIQKQKDQILETTQQVLDGEP